MLKQVYRILILIGVFIASLYYFSRDIKEVVFDIDNTTVMEETTFPLVNIRVGNEMINRIHGYSSNLDANKVREGVIPLSEDKAFEVMIQEEAYHIKKLNYELREFNGNELIETDSVSVFEEDGNYKTAKIKLKTELETEKEYAVKISLVTSDSKKIYYYQRVKQQNEAALSEKLEFVMSFHNAIKDKETAGWIVDRLETDRKQDNTTLAKVDIHSSLDLVTWGNLKPEFLTEVIPTVVETSPGLATVVLEYMIRAEIDGAPELFEVKEFYRVQYTNDKIYLLNYERTMEALFDPARASVAKNQLKLGITSDTEVAFLASPDKKKLAFIRNRELWFYNLEDNKLVRVFSFRQEVTDYIRDLYNQHDIRILNMDAEGNLHFLVYGYMNRGQYEGKVGIVLYRYIRAENRIEERVYIPVEEPYQILKENMGALAYVSALDMFYFHIYHNIYSYNLITGQTEVLAEGIAPNQVVFLPEKGYVAWQGNPDPRLSKQIKIMELETGQIQAIDALTGYNILLLDMIDSNLIYGLAAEDDITTRVDGRLMIPMDSVEIATFDREVLKHYSKPGYYVTEIAVKDNIIELNRVMRSTIGSDVVFAEAPQDYIMNQVTDEKQLVEVTTRVTDEALTEMYLTLPEGFTMPGIPTQEITVNTVITQDPTVRLQLQERAENLYYTYVAGELTTVNKSAAEAVAEADIRVGVVLNSRNQLVWERIAKPSKTSIPGYDQLVIEKTGETLSSCIRMLIRHSGKDPGNVSVNASSVYEVLTANMEKTPVILTGSTLEEALYYIAKGRPVIAMTDYKNALLIYGYDGFNINVADPAEGKVRKVGLQDSKEMFEGAGNVFISYLE